MSTGYIFDPIFLRHDTGNHPENHNRLEHLLQYLSEQGILDRLIDIPSRPATRKEILTVHELNHIIRVEETSLKGGGWLDPDTVMSADSYEAAVYAAGASIAATQVVMDETVTSSYALVRPPGHHATRTRAMGFCLFNNPAIAVKYALENYELERIAVIDFDVHHGNGTQNTFFDDPRVLYISSHQYPFFPNTGHVDETGRGDAVGTNINIPMPAGCGDEEYQEVYSTIVLPATRKFKPQLIFCSAGYDQHWNDPVAMMKTTITGIARIQSDIKDAADELCGGKLVYILEGGYDPHILESSIANTFRILLGDTEIDDAFGSPDNHCSPAELDSVLKEVKQAQPLLLS